jgi:hypothetical protein
MEVNINVEKQVLLEPLWLGPLGLRPLGLVVITSQQRNLKL